MKKYYGCHFRNNIVRIIARGIVIIHGTPVSAIDQAVAQSDGDGVGPVGGAEFSNGGLHMLVGGSLGDTQ